MSAWICSNYHISLLAFYAVREGLTNKTPSMVGEMLLGENVKSVKHRYGGKASEIIDSETFTLDARAENADAQGNAFALIKAAQCLDYQSCEHAGWEQSEAHQLLKRIEADVFGKMPVTFLKREMVYAHKEYERAPWGFDAPEDRAQAA